MFTVLWAATAVAVITIGLCVLDMVFGYLDRRERAKRWLPPHRRRVR